MKRSTRRFLIAGMLVLLIAGVLASALLYKRHVRKREAAATAAAAAAALAAAQPNPNDTATASLQWVPPTARADGQPLDGVIGYRIVYGKASKRYTAAVEIPAQVTSATVTGLSWDQNWYFAVMAIDRDGHASAPSAEVTKFTRR